jgi:transglutaminase-like putative cysteine protease/Tfp pilus assembly protein PilF
VLASACLLLLLVSVPASRLDAAELFHPDLQRALDELESVRGPGQYTALRALWDTWDRADPEQVEEALLLVRSQANLPPPVRAYAGLLSAYARSRRGDLVAARKTIQELGYVDHWLVVGPFDNEGKVGFDQTFEPERGFGEPIVPGRAFAGKERPVRWRRAPDAFPYGWLDFGALLRPQRNICAYATTFVTATRPAKAMSVWVGVGGAYKLFFNGQLVQSDDAYRGHDVDRSVVVVSLRPGMNNLTVKACGVELAPVVSVRLADEGGRGPAPVRTTSDPTESTEAARNIAHSPQDVLRKTRLEGPLQAFTRLIAAPKPPARLLEDFSRYLVLSVADDPARHQARDLAQRAAEAEPSVERLLLAASLAEDSNGAARWLDQAERLAKPGTAELARVLLARAALIAEKPTWRDAMPLYERALALDPDNVDAVRGVAGLYGRVRLGRTALAIVERALARQPRSVTLLNVYASQLRALGRAVEAAEVENRYAAFRFDDREFLRRQVELAVARRADADAERWITRLLEADPDSLWALDLASKSYRAMGRPEAALSSLERALALAPEDTDAIRALATLQGELGSRDRQLELMERLLVLSPQDRDAREYVDFLRPASVRPDEAYAWEPRRFLRDRDAPAEGRNQRTLRDLTVTTVYENGLSSRFRQIVFQPLSDAAAALARQYTLVYQSDRQAVLLRGAKVFRRDGRVDEAIESGEGAADRPELSMYTSARNFYIQLPRLEPGDVVELRYRVDDVALRNELADYFGEMVYLQSSEPVSNAEYVLITPRSRELSVDVRGLKLERSVVEKDKERIYRFFAPKLAPVSPEPAMPPWPEVLGYIHVSTYKTWEALGRWYWGFIQDQFVLDEETRRLARKIGRGAKTDRDKVEAVYRWVTENTRYVALEFGVYGYKPRRSVQTVARGWGDCKDKATVIVSLLKELGVESTLVILRTQLRGRLESRLPSLEPFDHAIVYVPSLDLFLDGTAEYAGMTELPVLDEGALGLLVNEGKSKLVTLPYADPEQDFVRRSVRARLDKEGGARLELAIQVQGASAPEWRRSYAAEATRRERLTKDVADDLPTFTLAKDASALVAKGLDDTSRPVELDLVGTAPGFARREGNTLSVPVTGSARLTPRYASLSRRRQDVSLLGFTTIDDRYSIELPRGATVVSVPTPAAGKSQFGSYVLEVTEKPGRVEVHSRIQVDVPRVTPGEYARWKAFCSRVDEAMSRRLTVRP